MDSYKEKIVYDWLKEHVGFENFCHGFERVKKVFSPIEFNDSKVVTIAGTNGKGETARSLGKILRQNGISTVEWTSPHVVSVAERFRLNGELIELDQLLELFKSCWKQVGDQGLSYYEFLFYVFCQFACKQNADVVILEVGLGGRLDAVNAFDPDITAITSISRDHQAILGESYRKILFEKLGITRPGVPLITSLELAYCRQIVEEYCQQDSIPWQDQYRDDLNFSARNISLAQAIAKKLIGKGDCNLALEGQFDSVKNFTFVGAHNLDGLRKLVELLEHRGEIFDRVIFSFSLRPVKEIMACVSLLVHNCSVTSRYILTTFEHVKAAHPEVLEEIYQKYQVEDFSFCNDWRAMADSSKEKTLLIGSYYFIGEVKKYLYEKMA